MVEGARLESVYTETYRGFESRLLRQIQVAGSSATKLGGSASPVGDALSRSKQPKVAPILINELP